MQRPGGKKGSCKLRKKVDVAEAPEGLEGQAGCGVTLEVLGCQLQERRLCPDSPRAVWSICGRDRPVFRVFLRADSAHRGFPAWYTAVCLLFIPRQPSEFSGLDSALRPCDH